MESLVLDPEEKTREKTENVVVFAYPILPGKADLERQRMTTREGKMKEEAYQKSRLEYRKQMGWTDVKIWLQKYPNEELHVMMLKGEDPLDADHIHTRFKKCIELGNPFAQEVREIYLETQAMDFCDRSAYADLEPVPGLSSEFTEEELQGKTLNEYAFAYPLLPGQGERVITYNRELMKDPERCAYFDALRKRMGIFEKQAWIQRGFGREMLVIYERLIEPVSSARDVWVDTVANEAIMTEYAQFYAEVTGLSADEMLPNLEVL